MPRLDDLAIMRQWNAKRMRYWNAPKGKKRQREKELQDFVYAQLEQEIKAKDKANRRKRA